MMAETRPFHLGDILSVTTGHLFSPSGVEGLHQILNWMTGESLMTHQLVRATEDCQEPLLSQHADLAAVSTPEFTGEAHVYAWLAEQVAQYGETRPVAPLPAGSRIRIDPIDELRMMAPHTSIHVVEVPASSAESPILRVDRNGNDRA